MPALEELFNHFERLDNQLQAGARDGVYLKLVKEILITRQELKKHIASHPDSSSAPSFREKLARIRNNHGYRIDTVFANYTAMISCPRCQRQNIALVKYRSAALPPADFVQTHNSRLKISTTPGMTAAGKFTCNDCCTRFDAKLPPTDARLCEVLFEYYG